MRLPVAPLGRLFRQLRWSTRGWSKSSDQAFHESLYANQDYDPFTFAYPGYITIRRFADLASEFLPLEGPVVDLGCGPGEITCELASRRPDLAFLGIDHSAEAIGRAISNAGRLQLSNARFEIGDLEAYEPPNRLGLVVMFDSFHHLNEPRSLVRRLGRHTSRMLLIEPRGGWSGGWQKDVDFDWLLTDLDNIRRRMAFLCGSDSLSDRAPQHAPSEPIGGAPVERRYTLDDLESFFDGWRLDIRGTVAGFEAYPPEAHGASESRRRFGQLAYDLIRSADESLLEQGRDLLAKHWVVHAQLGAGHGSSRRPPTDTVRAVTKSEISGPYDVAYLGYDGPTEAGPGERIVATVKLQNRGWEPWSSHDDRPVFVSYHWLDRSGRTVEFDGDRTPLPHLVQPGDTVQGTVQIRVPERVGRLVLAVELVRERVTWFSQAGQPWLAVPFTVRRS